MNAGRNYREIDRMATDFNIAVSERFLASVPITGSSPVTGFPLGPFQKCTTAIGSDPVLTGYIDNYLPDVEADRHAVHVTGRSKTEDIVDCTPDIAGGRFAGYKLNAIAPRDRRLVQDRRRCANRCRRAVSRCHD